MSFNNFTRRTETQCLAKGCVRPLRNANGKISGGNGYCKLHYDRLRSNGNLERLPASSPVRTKCKITECQLLYRDDRGKVTGGYEYCRKHYQRLTKYGNTETVLPQPRGKDHPHWRGGRLNHLGYVRVQVYEDDPYFAHATPIGGGRYIMEHRLVMAKHLGRPLRPQENVHHINGIRSDNRLKNLELWSSSQPPGQRVDDKIKWAHEILDLYKDLDVLVDEVIAEISKS